VKQLELSYSRQEGKPVQLLWKTGAVSSIAEDTLIPCDTAFPYSILPVVKQVDSETG
jgi:hypothetical protein